MSQFEHSRPLLDVSTCEHGHELTVTGVYAGDSFLDPNCRTKDGKMRQHHATLEKYPISEEWEEDVRRTEVLRERIAKAREVKKEKRK